MKKIIIAGFGQPVIDLYSGLKQNFEIVGIVLDYQRRERFPYFYEFLEKENLPLLTFESIADIQKDAVVVINYNKIIDCSQNNIPYLLNIHMGLLPVYRGNNANSLALLNGEKKVGYTLHEVSEVLDGGAIYYKFEYEIKENETYFEAKQAINKDIIAALPKVIDAVIAGELVAISQENEQFVYASKLVPEDGILVHWNFNTDDILNRYKIFARPLGTGLKMQYQGRLVEIGKIKPIKNFKNSKGFPGAVVLTTSEGSVWVKTKDTALSLEALIVDGESVLPTSIFKIGERL
jgi:methionyl-tRNA formyltransferase